MIDAAPQVMHVLQSKTANYAFLSKIEHSLSQWRTNLHTSIASFSRLTPGAFHWHEMCIHRFRRYLRLRGKE